MLIKGEEGAGGLRIVRDRGMGRRREEELVLEVGNRERFVSGSRQEPKYN